VESMRPKKTPLPLTPRNSSRLLTPSSIVNNIVSNEKQKMSLPFSNNINSLNKAISLWNNSTIDNDRPQILAWLSLLESKLQHQGIRGCQVENMGGMVLTNRGV